MKYEYEELLERAYSKLPARREYRSRFEIPFPRAEIVGKQTIIHNFKEILEALDRPPKHVLKFLFRELAVPGVFTGDRLILQGRITSQSIFKAINRYVNYYKICPICKGPDTKLVKDKETRTYFIVCEICGAKSPTKSIT